MSTTVVEPPNWCLDADTSCCGEKWDTYSPEVQARAVSLAASTFHMLTGYRVGGCPVTVRPCAVRCWTDGTWQVFPVTNVLGGSDGPFLRDGRWFNACGCTGDCACDSLSEVVLPGEVHSIIEVLLDGVVLDPSAYRIDNRNRLVRTDADSWPLCQTMHLPVTEDGTFAVTYRPGPAPDALDAYAVGLLACEYAKACTGSKCALPLGVQTISRQGVTMTIPSEGGLFPNGLTGIREVDVRLRFHNPHHLKTPSLVWSPDTKRPRRTTWEV